MTARGKIAAAVGGSALAHLLLVGGAVAWVAAGGIPDNDYFSLRTRLGDSEDVRVTGSNYAASREKGEPMHAGKNPQSGSVWWSWRAPKGTTEVLVQIELQDAVPLVGIYRGFAVDKLVTVASSANGTLSFVPQAGDDYHIGVAGDGADAEGLIKLHLQAFAEEDSEPPQPEEQETALLMPEVIIEEHLDDPKESRFVRTTQNDRAKDAPTNPSFESDRNTVAASEIAPDENGLRDMPSQDGVDLPVFEMRDREYTDGEISEDATIPIAAFEIIEPMLPAELVGKIPLDDANESDVPADEVEKEEKVAAAAATSETLLDHTPVADSGEFATENAGEEQPEGEREKPMDVPPTEDPGDGEKAVAAAKPPQAEVAAAVADTPKPAPAVGDESGDAQNVFQPETRRNKVVGTISNRGKEAAVDAAETALGRYTRLVTGAVEKRWHFERRRKADYVTPGNLKVSFTIGASGKAGGLKIIEDEANPVMTDFTLGAILNAEIPAMPKEVRELLGSEALEITYDVIIY